MEKHFILTMGKLQPGIFLHCCLINYLNDYQYSCWLIIKPYYKHFFRYLHVVTPYTIRIFCWKKNIIKSKGNQLKDICSTVHITTTETNRLHANRKCFATGVVSATFIHENTWPDSSHSCQRLLQFTAAQVVTFVSVSVFVHAHLVVQVKQVWS